MFPTKRGGFRYRSPAMHVHIKELGLVLLSGGHDGQQRQASPYPRLTAT